MKFHELKDKIMEGVKIRRNSWRSAAYIKYSKRAGCFVNECGVSPNVFLEAALADDWEEFIEYEKVEVCVCLDHDGNVGVCRAYYSEMSRCKLPKNFQTIKIRKG